MDKVRVGVIGVKSMGRDHVKSVQATPRMCLSAVCDIKKDTADKVAAENNVKAFYDTDEMLNSGEIDAVIIATPHYSHTPLAIGAFQAGIHVLCEKPVGVHKADVQKMIDAHKKRPDLKFAAMFQMRTDYVYKKLKELIENGELGELKRVNWIITNWFRSQSYYDSGGWRATWKGDGGGVLLNQCPHQLDLFQWFFGMPSKIRAFCDLGKYHNIEVEDNVTAYCEYPNGATGVFITSTGEAPGTNRLEISADRGRLVLEDGKITFLRTEVSVQEFSDTTDSRFGFPPVCNLEISVSDPGGSQHQRIIANFADAILDNTPLIAEGKEGINSVELANAMLFSSIKNKTVEMPLDADMFSGLLQTLIKNST